VSSERDGNFGVEHGPERGSAARRAAVTTRTRPASARVSFGHFFARGDDPLTWSVGLVTWCGYRVGVHWITVFWIALQVMLAIPADRIGPQNIAMVVGFVLLTVGLRESVRLWLARRVGGESEYVVLWPLGALVGPTPARAIGPNVLVSLAPTLVSVVVGCGLAVALWWMGATAAQRWFNPFDVRVVARSIESLPVAVVWWAFYANLVVAGLNLLPMLPLDGGRVLEAWAWHGRRDRARTIVGVLSIIIAGLVAIVGISADQPLLIAVAVFGGLAGWLELRRSEFVDQPAYVSPGLPPDWIVGAEPARSRSGTASIEPEPVESAEPVSDLHDTAIIRHEPERGARAAAAPVEPDEALLDRILAKISITGLDSLTEEERGVLSRATRRLKGE
jgi:Zn-dependent protease